MILGTANRSFALDSRAVLFFGLTILSILALSSFAEDAIAITWDEERAFSAGGGVAGTAADSEGDNLYYVWVQHGNPNDSIFFKWWNGEMWSLPDWLGYVQVYSWERPVMAVEDGVVHVAWRGSDDGDSGIYYRSFNGSDWSDVVLLTPDKVPFDQRSPTMAVDGGNVHIAWMDQRDGDYDVWYRQFDGRGWLPSEEISTDVRNEDQAVPDMVVDEGVVHIIWTVDDQIHYRKRLSGGWQSPSQVVRMENNLMSFNPSLAASDGIAYVTYTARNEDNEVCINMTVTDGRGWDPWGQVNGIRIHYEPYFRLDAEKGNLVLVYMEMMTTDVMFQHFNGSDWSEAEFINDSSAGDQWLPQVRLVDGVVHVTYTDMGMGKHKRGVIEGEPPTSRVTRTGPYWTGTEEVPLRWTLSDDFGIATISLEYRYGTDNATWSDWTEFMFEDGESGTTASGSYLFIPPDGDGFYEFHSIATDVWGNEEPAPAEADAGVGYDTRAPTGTIEIEGGADIADDPSVTLTLTYDDTTSGVAKVRYSNNAIGGDEPWEDPVETREWDLDDQGGQVTVYYQVIDVVGLLSQVYSDDIVLDTDQPTGTIEIDEGFVIVNTTLITVMLTYDDDTGVEAIRLSNDAIWDENDWQTPAGSVVWQLPEGDIGRVVYYQVKDMAERVSEIYELNLRVDTTDPSLEAIDPTNGSDDVPVDAYIRLQFSEALKPLSVNNSLDIYFLDKDDSSHDLVGNLSWESNWRTFTFEPFSDLEEGTTYYIKLGPEVQDLAGNRLYPAVLYSFTTEGEAPGGDNDNGTAMPWGLIISLLVVICLMGAIIAFLMFGKRPDTS
jgi:hypothetical protein